MLRPKYKFDSEIPCVASTPCKPIYAQATRAAGAHLDHMAGTHLRFPLLADNPCVFLNNALGNLERHQEMSSFMLIVG